MELETQGINTASEAQAEVAERFLCSVMIMRRQLSLLPYVLASPKGRAKKEEREKLCGQREGWDHRLSRVLIALRRDANAPFTRVCKRVFKAIATEPTEKGPVKRIKPKNFGGWWGVFFPCSFFSRPWRQNQQPTVLRNETSTLSKSALRVPFSFFQERTPPYTLPSHVPVSVTSIFHTDSEKGKCTKCTKLGETQILALQVADHLRLCCSGSRRGSAASLKAHMDIIN